MESNQTTPALHETVLLLLHCSNAQLTILKHYLKVTNTTCARFHSDFSIFTSSSHFVQQSRSSGALQGTFLWNYFRFGPMVQETMMLDEDTLQ